jgi:hypothetical protein
MALIHPGAHSSHSLTESELHALDEATRKLVHLQKLLKDFDVQHLSRPVTTGQDKLSAISLSHAAAYNPRTKHIATRYMYVNQIQEQGEVLIKHLSTDSIPSGALTKPLHGAPHSSNTQMCSWADCHCSGFQRQRRWSPRRGHVTTQPLRRGSSSLS